MEIHLEKSFFTGDYENFFEAKKVRGCQKPERWFWRNTEYFDLLIPDSISTAFQDGNLNSAKCGNLSLRIIPIFAILS
jgi:hypothetical protein